MWCYLFFLRTRGCNGCDGDASLASVEGVDVVDAARSEPVSGPLEESLPLVSRELVVVRPVVRPPLEAPALAGAFVEPFAAPPFAPAFFAGREVALIDFDFDFFAFGAALGCTPKPKRCFQDLVPSGALMP
jgi:hypothetical protein